MDYIWEIIGIICVVLSLVIGTWAGYRDIVAMEIPNHCSVAVLGLWVIAALSGIPIATPWKAHLVIGLIFFAVGVLFYALNLWGGGDAKLMAGYGFWLVPHSSIQYLFWMTIIGGILALVSLVITKKPAILSKLNRFNGGHWLQQLKQGKTVIPYGIAIVAAAWIVLFPSVWSFLR